MKIGNMLHQWLTKLEWFSTMFPRIPVPIQKQIESKVNNYCQQNNVNFANPTAHAAPIQMEPEKKTYDRRERSDERNRCGGRDRSRERFNRNDDRYEQPRRYRSRSKEREDRERDRGDRGDRGDRDRNREYRHR